MTIKPNPVAWCLVYEDRRAGPIYSNPTMHFESAEAMERMSDGRVEVVPLYTTPPQRKPLTDEEVVNLKMLGRDLEFVSMTALRRFAQAIEAKLKEKNNAA